MSIQWTGPMIKKCIDIYTSQGSKAAAIAMGTTVDGVCLKMREVGIKSIYNPSDSLKPRARMFFAEDVAAMFEFYESGVKSKIISEYFDSTASIIRGVISRAKKHGLSAYPMRSSQ